MLDDASDFALLERWRAGDRTAGNLLFTRHFDALYNFLKPRARNDVREIAQRTLLACVESVDRFRHEASFRSYLLQIARYQLYAHYRRRGADWCSNLESLARASTSPSGCIARKQEQQLVVGALRSLPVVYQTVLALRFWDGLSGSEIAQVLAVPEPTVRSRLRRATEALREILSKSQSVQGHTWGEDLRAIVTGSESV